MRVRISPLPQYQVKDATFQPDKMRTSTFTPRETEIFNGILAGNTAAKDVAQMFRIKQSTARKHIERIRQKTGVRKAALPRWAAENGGTE